MNIVQLLMEYKEYLFLNYSFSVAMALWNQLVTAVYRYVVKGLGFSWGEDDRKIRKLGPKLMQQAESFLKTVDAQTFIVEALDAQNKGFAYFEVSSKTEYTYRCALKKLLDFASNLQDEFPPDCIPFKVRRGYGRVADNPVVYRPNLGEYGLNKSQLTEVLSAEISDWQKFRTQKYYPGRKENPVSESTFEGNYNSLLLILGWKVNILCEDINSLTLVTLIPCLERGATLEQHEEVQGYVELWFCDFLTFLQTERLIECSGTIMSFYCCLLAVTKFHYRHCEGDNNYAQVPLIRFLRNRINQLSKQKKTEQPVADMSKKWMELPVFRDEVLEPLRLCCRCRKNCGDMRELSAVAWSLEGHVIVGNLCYMPPRRQQEMRDLKLSLSCPIKRPANLAPGGLVHPLPPDRLIGKNRKHGFLYRDEQGIWYRDMTPESYKTGHIYGHQVLKIPNIKFSDGFCFYDYIEMWLYGYYYAPNGVLKANGSKFDPTGCYHPRIYETRALFNPDHNFVFCQKNGTNFKATNLGKFFTNLCHGLTGVRVTPHLLRDMYATYYLDQGSSDALIRSLAYAMGHSVETLRKIYDRRRPEQKRRQIEEAVIDFFENPSDHC